MDQGNANDVLKLPFGPERRDAWRMLNPKIGRKNQLAIDECNAIFAVLDGTDVDSGTAAEIGYGFARGKKFSVTVETLGYPQITKAGSLICRWNTLSAPAAAISSSDWMMCQLH
jgi:hypothetical protein